MGAHAPPFLIQGLSADHCMISAHRLSTDTAQMSEVPKQKCKQLRPNTLPQQKTCMGLQFEKGHFWTYRSFSRFPYVMALPDQLAPNPPNVLLATQMANYRLCACTLSIPGFTIVVSTYIKVFEYIVMEKKFNCK